MLQLVPKRCMTHTTLKEIENWFHRQSQKKPVLIAKNRIILYLQPAVLPLEYINSFEMPIGTEPHHVCANCEQRNGGNEDKFIP
jgi:hypothetical protein